ncbi:glutamate/tyrosine decarboxylase-like PLP-dependent enzyme [Allocatelliglobosispora scoriae]|uniref:Glutamate/tyrosine decarboxylase-like PLP-dependent enzyme n=1 Tax=Allocatelliglobosispora scoriae TaxID=643052 RepID=A0A841BWG8_9ACTN|nr:aminotransferase class V-fold PLP-dependent enzyme [Allocatelliglobosispora scoriae]MBB5873457.1 glutamate/tyrosine decarboxylase-like PLP-dependent enzyme [Allocatelliglobosispora scoriae]
MNESGHLLRRAAEHAISYRESVADAAVGATETAAALATAFGGPLPVRPTDPAAVLEELVAAARGGLVATTGPRFFGFVVGGALPAATAAEMLAAAWDQNAFNGVLAPAAIAAETAAGGWLKELLGLPASASTGFVTGGQEANTVGLAAARHHVLEQLGWDVERHGLAGAPRVPILAGVERHATIDRSLRLLGFGTEALLAVPAGPDGAIDIGDLRRLLPDGPAIVCLQAGNVNTGACDDLRAACELVHERGGWVHVDGAFGLWAAASPATRHLVDGIELADSWACDGHKWLNVPYDSGFAFCSRPQVHAAAVSYTASYLVGSGTTAAAADFTLESSRRARGFAVWAALRELGRDGVAELIERCCRLARRFAEGLDAAGFEVVNDVVLNQVLVGFGDDARTERVIEAIQRDGTCWMGATTWRGRRLMRISVSGAATTESDVDLSVDAIRRLAAAA